MKFWPWIGIIWGMLLALPVPAQQRAPDPCQGDGGQISLNLCAQQRFQLADDTLNLVWKRLRAGRYEGATDPLRDVQRLWLRYRDLHCAQIAEMGGGGSMVPMLKFNCLCRLTEQRTQELMHFIELDGGK